MIKCKNNVGFMAFDLWFVSIWTEWMSTRNPNLFLISEKIHDTIHIRSNDHSIWPQVIVCWVLGTISAVHFNQSFHYKWSLLHFLLIIVIFRCATVQKWTFVGLQLDSDQKYVVIIIHARTQSAQSTDQQIHYFFFGHTFNNDT